MRTPNGVCGEDSKRERVSELKGGRGTGGMLETTYFDASLHPSFFTKSVRLNRTELSIGGICSKSRDLAF